MPLPLTSVTAFDPAAPPKVRGTLLIVDDEEGPRQSLRVVFKEEYNLLLASDGLRALELAGQNQINVAVIDIRMSGMSGIAVLERLKVLQPGIQVIMLTAYETIDTVRQALRLGACDYLNKPFDIATIRRSVATAMQRHSLSDEIRNNNDKLAGLQAELKNQQLQEEITRSRGEIYASIIHDINGPLTIISGFISLIDQRIGASQRLEEEDLTEVRDRLKFITYQVNNCIEISHRYLSFMRQRSTAVSRVWINQIFSDLQQLLKAHPSKGLHTLEVQPRKEDVELQINGTDLIQILLNLSINALQSTTTPLSVTIFADVICTTDEAPHQDGPNDRFLGKGAFESGRSFLKVIIRDNGPGISPEIMEKLFQTYITTKPVGKGTGLGLSIVHRLINEAKGALHLHSKVGEGTTFTLHLPLWLGEA